MKQKALRFSSIAAGIAFLAVFFGAAINNTPDTNAISTADFKAGNIIDDAVFYNKNTMTVADIQAHLNRYMPTCDTWGTGPVGSGRYINGKAVPASTTRADYARQMRAAGKTRYHDPPYICVQNYYENPTTHETLYETKNVVKDGMISAAQIIYNAAQKYNVNPQVLLVLLKKESYVWGDNWPLKDEYNTVMGYACPDNAPCDSKYFGFYNQVEMAAWQLNYYKEHIYSYNYRPYATNYILYSPEVSCGRKEVYLENLATTSLYIYTPYTPNDAALRNYPGTATCGSYGNRNFFMYFSEWFGSTHTNVAEKKIIPNAKYRILGSAYDFERNSDNSYLIKNSETGLVLGLKEGRAVVGAEVSPVSNSGNITQKWFVYGDGKGGYYLANAGNASYIITTDTSGKNVLGIYGDDKNAPIKMPMTANSELKDGDYHIQSALKDKYVISIASSSVVNMSTLTTQNINNQSYKISYDENTGYYKIANKQGKVMTVDGVPVKDMLNLTFNDDKSECTQRFAFVKKSDGKYTIVSSCDLGYMLDVAYSYTKDGSSIVLYHEGGTTNQEWSLREVETPAPTPTVSNQVLPNGKYAILSALRANFAIDIWGGYKNDGANVNAWTQNNDVAQIFEITYDSSRDAYHMVNPNSGKALSFAGTKTVDSANIQISNVSDSCSQYWKIIKKSNGKYMIASSCDANYVLDIACSYTKDGSNIILFHDNGGSKNQEWSFEKLESSTSSETPAPTQTASNQVLPNGKYAILSALRANFAIDIWGGYKNDGANVNAWTQNNDVAQIFEITYDSSRDAYHMVNPNSGKALSFAGTKTVDSANIQISNVSDSCSQYWKIIKKSNGKYMIASSCDANYVLDIACSYTKDGSNIILFHDNGGSKNQEWSFEKL